MSGAGSVAALPEGVEGMPLPSFEYRYSPSADAEIPDKKLIRVLQDASWHYYEITKEKEFAKGDWKTTVLYLSDGQIAKIVTHPEVPTKLNIKAMQDEAHISCMMAVAQSANLFQKDKDLLIFMDNKGESLEKYISRGRQPAQPLSVAVFQKILLQSLAQLKEMHDKGILHRDIKPENMAFGERLSFIDYGSAGNLSLRNPGVATQKGVLISGKKTTSGNRYWISKNPGTIIAGVVSKTPVSADKIPKGTRFYNIGTDVFALGVSLLQIFAGVCTPENFIAQVKAQTPSLKVDARDQWYQWVQRVFNPKVFPDQVDVHQRLFIAPMVELGYRRFGLINSDDKIKLITLFSGLLTRRPEEQISLEVGLEQVAAITFDALLKPTAVRPIGRSFNFNADPSDTSVGAAAVVAAPRSLLRSPPRIQRVRFSGAPAAVPACCAHMPLLDSYLKRQGSPSENTDGAASAKSHITTPVREMVTAVAVLEESPMKKTKPNTESGNLRSSPAD